MFILGWMYLNDGCPWCWSSGCCRKLMLKWLYFNKNELVSGSNSKPLIIAVDWLLIDIFELIIGWTKDWFAEGHRWLIAGNDASLIAGWRYNWLPVRTSITVDDSVTPERLYSQSGKRIKWVELWVPFVLLHGGSVQWQVVAQWWAGRKLSSRTSLQADSCLERCIFRLLLSAPLLCSQHWFLMCTWALSCPRCTTT